MAVYCPPLAGDQGGGMAQMKIIAGLPRVFAKQSGGKFRYMRSVFRVFRTTIRQFLVFYARFFTMQNSKALIK